MLEIRWHGRGGQGAVTSVELLALSAIEEGKYAQGFPSFGPERRGAPVTAFNRVDDKQIKIRSGIYHPDVVVVLDESLVGLVDVAEGLEADGDPAGQHDQKPGGAEEGHPFRGQDRDLRRHGDRLEGTGRAHHEHDHAGRPGQADGRREARIPGQPRSRSGSAGSRRRTMAAAKRAYEEVKIIN